jgi:hypothetical protein
LNLVLLLGISTVAVFSIGCGGSPPELLQLFWQKNVVFDRENDHTYESLSLWINCSDEDGTEDFAYLYLIHDEEELFWELTDEMWQNDERGSAYWIGTNEFVMHDRSDFPSGHYRVVLIDAAGDRDERRFFVSAGPGFRELVFPRLIPGTQWEIVSPHRENSLWVYDSAGNLVGSYDIEGNSFDPGEFIEGISETRRQKEEEQGPEEKEGENGIEDLETGGVRFYAYAYDDDRGVGLITKSYEYIPSGN